MSLRDGMAYATHQSVLRELGQRPSMQRVLEFGVGPASTPLFLDEQAFPYLTHLMSVENDPRWVTWASSKFTDPTCRANRCFTLVEATAAMQEYLRFPLGYDLCFVDSLTTEMRLVVIEHRRNLDRFIVLHDAQHTDYAPVIAGFKRHKMHKAVDGLPWTAVMSNLEEVE